ncbi:hypothetical protein AB7952_00205 [Streptomyces sp. PG2]
MRYLFADEQLPGPATPAQHRLADTMVRYWARFARTGDPNGPGRGHRRGGLSRRPTRRASRLSPCRTSPNGSG